MCDSTSVPRAASSSRGWIAWIGRCVRFDLIPQVVQLKKGRMGINHPSSTLSLLCRLGMGTATFLSLGERLVFKAMLCPAQGVPFLPLVNISGGDSMGTSFLYGTII